VVTHSVLIVVVDIRDLLCDQTCDSILMMTGIDGSDQYSVTC